MLKELAAAVVVVARQPPEVEVLAVGAQRPPEVGAQVPAAPVVVVARRRPVAAQAVVAAAPVASRSKVAVVPVAAALVGQQVQLAAVAAQARALVVLAQPVEQRVVRPAAPRRTSTSRASSAPAWSSR
ncbi:MAG: hypothetical protein M3380_10580 [Chloroflexota bacterium]|nr:hypothetical protein [Chloroflexota bacterium]